jgi:sugar O-acyltransferase (sialic acid O-acetyltransferase NeuD family)
MGKLAVLGSGGFAKEVAELAQLNGHIIEACYSAKEGEFRGLHRGYLKELESDRDEFDGVILGVGAIDRRSLAIRRGLVDWLVDRQFRCPPIVSPHAVCAQGVTIGEGVVVAHGVIMGVDSQAASFAIFNSGSMVGHDARIGANVIIAPGAFLGGGVQVGENSLVGPLAKVLQGVTLGEDTLVGVGCLVVSSLHRGQTIWPRLDRPS